MTTANQSPETFNPIYEQASRDVERGWRRFNGDWSDFTYKFTLTESAEQYFRKLCEEYSLDFDREWRQFNDLYEPAQAQTLARRKAEDKWHRRRIDKPMSVFRGCLDARHIMKQDGLYPVDPT